MALILPCWGALRHYLHRSPHLRGVGDSTAFTEMNTTLHVSGDPSRPRHRLHLPFLGVASLSLRWPTSQGTVYGHCQLTGPWPHSTWCWPKLTICPEEKGKAVVHQMKKPEFPALQVTGLALGAQVTVGCLLYPHVGLGLHQVLGFPRNAILPS